METTIMGLYRVEGLGYALGGCSRNDPIVPRKEIEYGFGYITIRSPYTSYSVYLRGTI